MLYRRYRADSLEAMLAEIPSRFSIQKSLSIGSPSSNPSSSQTLGAGQSARDPQPILGPASIPSRRSRDVPGLQLATSALRQPCESPGGSHVIPDPVANGEMPRYATCRLWSTRVCTVLADLWSFCRWPCAQPQVVLSLLPTYFLTLKYHSLHDA